jgi:hypothetical protein
MTPTQQVTWTVVGAAVYSRHGVKLIPVDKRWGLIPRSRTNMPPRLVHICKPRKIYWDAKAAYRTMTFQHKEDAKKKGPFDLKVETVPWGPGSKAEKLTLVMNGFTALNHDTMNWVLQWDCQTLESWEDCCTTCHVDAPYRALALQGFLKLGEKL